MCLSLNYFSDTEHLAKQKILEPSCKHLLMTGHMHTGCVFSE